MKLNLDAKNDVEKKLLDYLESNASESLAAKINSGTHYEKDGKNLINKKDLVGFLNYANSEARKLAEKGANCACVDAQTVFGWAIHYFEEDDIIGTLYNQDGTKYEEPKKIAPPKTTCNVSPPPKPKEPTLFDLLSAEPTESKPEKPKEEQPQQEKQLEQEQIVIQDNKKVNLDTGEVIEKIEYPSIDKECMYLLYEILDGKLEVQ